MIKVGLYVASYNELGLATSDLDSQWNQFPPLGLGYLASYARKYVGNVEFVIERTVDALIAAKPDIVGISYVTYSVRLAERHAIKVKEALGCPVIAGGPHISTLPTVLPKGFDFAVLNEGEETFAELLRLYQAEGEFAPESLAKVKGLLYRDADGVLQRTEPRPFIEDLDTVPYPDRDLMFEKWRRPGPSEMQILTSRGCPYRCAFCSTQVHWGRRFRFPTEDYVVNELELIRRNYNPETIHFFDDLFITNRGRTLRLLASMRERGLHKGVSFTGFVRSNLLDDELMESMAKTNFSMLNVGFESGSDSVLATFKKDSADLASHRNAVVLARKHGLKFASCFILGAPGETRQDIVDSFEFVSANIDVLSFVRFNTLMVFPGTQAFEWAKEQNGITDEDLGSVAPDLEDYLNMAEFLKHRWLYFNEKSIPREELLNYIDIGDRLSRIVAAYHEVARQKGSLSFVADNFPLSDIVKHKARKHLSRVTSDQSLRR